MKDIKSITQLILGAVVASALTLAIPQKALAQEVVIATGSYAPAPGFYAPLRYDDWRGRNYVMRERWEARRWQHERWERARFYDRHFYSRY